MENYRKKHREVKKIMTKQENIMWETACKNIEQNIGGARSSESWRRIKSLRNNTTEKTQITYIKEERWQDYYRKLLTENRPRFIETQDEDKQDGIENTTEEILVTLKEI